ncbi:MAG: gluconolaconase [Planctomycetes bacterium]|nr:gluconolaconase [Planctomycetota bacterium]
MGFVQVTSVWNPGTTLGEGPVWSVADGALLWLDIKGRRAFRFTPATGAREVFDLPEEVGAVAPRRAGGLVAAARSGFAFLDLEGGALVPIADPEDDLPGNRFNDGKCDPSGSFFAGTMDDACERPTGSLYRLAPDLTVECVDTGYVVTNGPAFAPDGRTMVHTASLARTIFAFDRDPTDGALSGRRVLRTLDSEEGLPDGMTYDAEGFLWCAHWAGGRVSRLAPDGSVERVLHIAGRDVTSCAFGGEELDLLYVTTAEDGLFAAEVGVGGLPPAEFGG